MRTTTFAGEKMSALLEKAFGTVKAKDRARLQEALVRANPQLRRMRDVKRGAVLVVPDVPGVAPAGRSADDSPTLAMMESVRTAVQAFATHLHSAAAAAKKDLVAERKLLESRTLQAPIEARAEIQRIAEALRAEIDARAERIEAVTRFEKTVLPALKADLDALADRVD